MNAAIHDSVRMGRDVTVGHHVVIEEGVEIGDNTVIGHNVVIRADSRIGSGVRIDDNAVIGKQPMRGAISTLKVVDELPPARIGNGCLIGTGAVIYAGCEVGDNVLVADLATLRENVSVGERTIVGRGVAIENYTTIGRGVKLETGCYITARSVVEDFCFIAPMVATSNDNFLGRTKERFKYTKGPHIEEGARVGVNATLLPGVRVGRDAVVAAGSVLTGDAPPRKIVLGTPAKVWRDTPKEQLLENQ